MTTHPTENEGGAKATCHHQAGGAKPGDPAHFDADLAEAIKKGDRSSMDIIAEQLAGSRSSGAKATCHHQADGAGDVQTYVDPTAMEDPNYNRSVDPENNGYTD